MVKRLLVNGCSFSRGPGSWPYHVAEKLNANICNLSQSGAGNTYIRQATIAELSQRDYDLVLINWTGLERIDVQVENIDSFNTPYTSKHQSLQNDWPEKIIWPIDDQDYVEKNWVFGCGYINGDSFLRRNNLFSGLYKHVGMQQHRRRSLTDMICLQDFLRVRKINYTFGFFVNYRDQLAREKDLWPLIDQNNLIDRDLFTIASELDNFEPDGLHPGTAAHYQWANNILDHLGTCN